MNNFVRVSALLAFAALPAAAATFTINNTGGAPGGSVDPNWLVNSGVVRVTMSGIFPLAVPEWLANNGTSSWISPQANYGGPQSTWDLPGTYVYSTTFDLTGLNPGTAALTFRVAADDQLTNVILNGVSQGITFTGFTAFSGSFNINSDFVAGVNTIQFVTLNAGAQRTPNGLRVEFTSATADANVSGVPEPSSIALLGFGTLLLFSRRFRSAK